MIMAMACLSDLQAHTLPLSRHYQKGCVDGHKARNTLTDAVAVLTTQSKNREELFGPLYEQAIGLGDELRTELRLPRNTKRQNHSYNTPALDPDPDSFYRMSVYIPLLYYVLADLKSRFNEDNFGVCGLFVFMPSQLYIITTKDEANVVTYIAQRHGKLNGRHAPITASVDEAELRIWREKWKRESAEGADIPLTAVEALYMYDGEMFPSIKTLLQIMTTLIVSVASIEWSFSTLRRLKTWLRSQMRETRLTSLAYVQTQPWS
ncbi:hypothetical protein HPB49_013732 [Dermacentor silvarum]|uniref:Uncharacterized protein n=1 Tax=Dermacentor silvarum TaxID=543639 RepID=A0ACB8E0Q7_DERSI|nr:hypothetical protein HPB49_013732 [Dermacentor silvarum]